MRDGWVYIERDGLLYHEPELRQPLPGCPFDHLADWLEQRAAILREERRILYDIDPSRRP